MPYSGVAWFLCEQDMSYIRDGMSMLRAAPELSPHSQELLEKLTSVVTYSEKMMVCKNFLTITLACLFMIKIAAASFIIVALNDMPMFRSIRWTPPRWVVSLKTNLFAVICTSNIVAVGTHLLYVFFADLAPVPTRGTLSYLLMCFGLVYAAVGCFFFSWCASCFVLSLSTKLFCLMFLHSVHILTWFLFYPHPPELQLDLPKLARLLATVDL